MGKIDESVNHAKAVLSLNRALRGEVSPALRAARIYWDEKNVSVYFYYDWKISGEDEESAQFAATEVIADFPDRKLDVQIVRCDYPQKLPEIGALVYPRKIANIYNPSA